MFPFLKKDDNRMPNNYAMTVEYLDGSSDTFELASHHLGQNILEFITKDDIIHWVRLETIKKVNFDKRFSKIVHIKQEKEREAQLAAQQAQQAQKGK